MDLLFFFQWLDNSALASVSKSASGPFAMVQTIHIASMVMLVGMLMLGDLRMLNIVLKGVPAETVINNTKKWVNIALVGIILSGIYEMSAIAMKLYYNEAFLAKMIGLGLGIAFVYFIRNPVFARAPALAYGDGGVAATDAVSALNIKLVAGANLLTWLTVAACGRWIGFS